MQGVTIERDTAIRMAEATRKVENDGVDLRSSQTGRRDRVISSDINKHYFLAIKTASDKITIIDGFDEDNAVCGNISANKLAITPVSSQELTIADDAYIYLVVEGVYTGVVLTSVITLIDQYDTEQSWESGKEKQLISRVLFNTSITDFSNEPVSSRVDIRGTC